jgi:phage terminase large subunit-like protein
MEKSPKVTWKTWLKGEGRQYTKAKYGEDWRKVRSNAYESAKSPGLSAIA